MAEVRCPTPSCNKVLAEGLVGELVITCRHCKRRHVITRGSTVVAGAPSVAGALSMRSTGSEPADTDRRPR